KNKVIADLKSKFELKKEKNNLILENIQNKIFNPANFKANNYKRFYTFVERIYSESVPISYRKKHGEFYTPYSIVKEILDSVNYSYNYEIKNKSIIDISCGIGSFLTKCITEIIKKIIIRYNRKSIKDFNVNELKDIIKIIQDNVYGIDINPIACLLCYLNIYFELFEIIEEITKKNNNYKIPAFNILNISSFKLFLNNSTNDMRIKKFDFIVGNPPYIFIRDIQKEQKILIKNTNLITNSGQYDYYQLFIEMGLNLLKDGGFLGYIIPDSLLALSNRKKIRKYIYENAWIKEIHIVGNQFSNVGVSNIILVLKKRLNAIKNHKKKIKIIFNNRKKKDVNYLSQKYIKHWNYNYLIHLTEVDIEILDHLNSMFPRLKNLINNEGIDITLNRGVELGKEGNVIFCENCNTYQPIPRGQKVCYKCGNIISRETIKKIILNKKPINSPEKYKKFIYSMERYKINKFKYINTSLKGINYKNFDSYRNRIIIRQISQNNLICATYYPGEALTSQSVYNLKIENSNISGFNSYYLLGLLNSDLLSYYFIKSFGSYKALFPRILIEKIRNFPIIVPKTDYEVDVSRKLIKTVKNILQQYKNTTENLNLLENRSSEYVFELYKISFDERMYIKNFLKDFKMNH
ncbi:MAG: TaqI-like C-terminal specificity domain-containing protein, partial [Candidatus Lokiarchaeota archaeon]